MMRWFYNMKIAVKLIICFIIVALIAGVIGVIGVVDIKNVDSRDTELYEKMTVPLGELVIIVESYQRMRGNVKDILLATNAVQINDYENRIKQRNEEFNKNIESFQKTLLTEEGRKLYDGIIEHKKQYDKIVADIINYVKSDKRDEALTLMNGEGDRIRTDM
jgi:methyl-accepting chemotaxis protein